MSPEEFSSLWGCGWRSPNGCKLNVMKISRRAVLAAPLAFQMKAQSAATSAQDTTRARRMQWWHDAKFGMFIHFGLYSVLGRHEWAM
jgi:hypothetical protein